MDDWNLGTAGDEIMRLAREGRKIEAIKLLREITGLDLRQSKEMVERLELGGPPPAPAGLAEANEPPLAARQAMPARVEGLLRQGRKIDAVKALRDAEGLGLKEAHDRIMAHIAHRPELAARNQTQGNRGLLVVVGIVVVVLLFVFART